MGGSPAPPAGGEERRLLAAFIGLVGYREKESATGEPEVAYGWLESEYPKDEEEVPLAVLGLDVVEEGA